MADESLRSAVVHTVFYTALFVPASVLGRPVHRGGAEPRRSASSASTAPAIFVPFVASAAAIGILANYLFDPQFGFANNVIADARACPRRGSSRTRSRRCS